MVPTAASFDARGTVRANLRHWDAERQRLVVERPLFFQRNTRRIPWEVVLVVDQSGSMFLQLNRGEQGLSGQVIVSLPGGAG